MRRNAILLVVALMTILVLAACGSKSQEDVVKDLNEKVEKMKGYKADAQMTLQVGEESQTYDVEVWNKEHNFYRVVLKTPKKDQSQMILRNESGVYVLTPALNKSFKFQSDWPKNSSQAYLYESLVADILEDKEAKFKETKDHYIFETKTRYQNSQMLPTQKITFNKKDLSPVSVKVLDTDRNALVKVKFNKVNFNASFENASFDMKKNMTGAQLEVPVLANSDDRDFSVQYVEEMPGISLVEENEIVTEDGKRVVLTYAGDKQSFTLVQEKSKVMTTSIEPTEMSGEMIDLGFTIGSISEHSISWTYNGVDYLLASKDLSKEEMIEIARSVHGNSVK
ncbi:outer membrane lipoprotein-sorting protein [Oikeobacillus pervagus]|uniref:Outer membrane lipoprotein-sorting protein n=1 Tax=Oikeobacillus pervagus TaxID=1325931 RepID=A0AAJ1WHU5_9BACI|nr:outer membrane lipoprotein carrier protein LolA [Oikeobacillus pervagus]MDQ0216587.1 outer membrane lipoprotein-sorting protein [Oikeobacillus pervagus]